MNHERAIARGTFKNVERLTEAIERFIETTNTSPVPFVWTAAAEEILAKVRRARSILNKMQSE